jgi:hypothetical protein
MQGITSKNFFNVILNAVKNLKHFLNESHDVSIFTLKCTWPHHHCLDSSSPKSSFRMTKQAGWRNMTLYHTCSPPSEYVILKALKNLVYTP